MKADLDTLLRPLMESKGVTVSPQEFHRAVNLTYHDIESLQYDALHHVMVESLPWQFELLCGDIEALGLLPGRLAVLDVGCGTGLSTELILRTALGQRAARIDLLDTSPGMLAACARRAASWGVRHNLIEGTIDQVAGRHYDLVLACSVLHHIVDLGAFFGRIAGLQVGGGVVLHLHDPNGDHLRDPDLLRRTAEFQACNVRKAGQPSKRSWSSRILQRIRGRSASCTDTLNQILLGQKIIRHPMTDEEVWSVTDIHDYGLPYSTGEGISLRRLKQLMTVYNVVSCRSYGFYGCFPSELPEDFAVEERRLSSEGCMEGKFVGAAWRRLDVEVASHRVSEK